MDNVKVQIFYTVFTLKVKKSKGFKMLLVINKYALYKYKMAVLIMSSIHLSIYFPPSPPPPPQQHWSQVV